MTKPRRPRATLRLIGRPRGPRDPPTPEQAALLDRIAARVERGEVDPDRLAAYLDEETDAEGPENP